MKARLESVEGHWLLCALRTRVHVELGYATFTEYVERLFGYDARSVREKLRVAEALECLPELGRALSSGQLCWSAVRELTRVATAETEAEWLEAARGKTSRELEQEVSGRKPGDRPGDPAEVSIMRHVLRFEVSAELRAPTLTDAPAANATPEPARVARCRTRFRDVPPSVRRLVLRRDRGCCVVPGCRHVVFVDIHHVRPRSEGGGHDPDGIVVLCAAHHRAVHRGQLVIEGSVSTGLVFRHADGRAYGQAVCAAAAEACTRAFGALRTMGFSETETRRALEKTRSTGRSDGRATRRRAGAAQGARGPDRRARRGWIGTCCSKQHRLKRRACQAWPTTHPASIDG